MFEKYRYFFKLPHNHLALATKAFGSLHVLGTGCKMKNKPENFLLNSNTYSYDLANKISLDFI